MRIVLIARAIELCTWIVNHDDAANGYCDVCLLFCSPQLHAWPDTCTGLPGWWSGELLHNTTQHITWSKQLRLHHMHALAAPLCMCVFAAGHVHMHLHFCEHLQHSRESKAPPLWYCTLISAAGLLAGCMHTDFRH
jgi:hypothetical protein